MRASKLFLSWVVLTSTAASLSTPERWRFDLEVRGLLDKRQDPQATDSLVSTTAAPSDIQPTTSEAVPTSDSVASSISPVTTSQPVPSPLPTSDAVPTGSSSSVPLLFTQTQPTSRTIVTTTPVPTANNSDSNVAFFDSKYHQLIIALASISAALLVALIAMAIIAFRARADNDLLHDQLSRYEEGISLEQRGKGGSVGTAGGYGRLSLHDPDDTRHSRRSLSESQLKPMAGRRLSGTPMGSGTPPGNRRVTFGSESTHTHSSSGHSLLLGPNSGKDAPSESLAKPAISPDTSIRRLPMAPKTSGSHESYTDPFAGAR
ncbi:hypothetical protein RhiJN_09128 [Ceratobasidium sp. AG-Ba]|nr:hypothetical protein RhiJN_09128 [Ceratobasidium sp. AG-Ba]QRW09894.1 hypothetical protein RhiLY_08893 [Ceratobasidium sp. AG-Ba]